MNEYGSSIVPLPVATNQGVGGVPMPAKRARVRAVTGSDFVLAPKQD